MCAAGALVPGAQPCLPAAASISPSLTAFQYALLLQHRYHSYANNGLLHQHKAISQQQQPPGACFAGIFRPPEDVNDVGRGRSDDRGFRRVERDTDGVLASPEDRQDSGKYVEYFVESDYFCWELSHCGEDGIISLFL